MTHKEFKLTVKTEILEKAGYSVQAVEYHIGDTMIVNEDVFGRLLRGERIERPTNEGHITFDKYNFENEVAVTSITVEYGVRKLGQRK